MLDLEIVHNEFEFISIFKLFLWI